MPIIYYIFLISFLGFPLIGLILSNYIKITWASKFAKAILIFFIVHNLFFLLGYSLKGDYIDYIIFSIEYLIFCYTVYAVHNSTNKLIKAFRGVGLLTIVLGFLFGFLGIAFFIFMSMDFETNKIFHFENNDKKYETRRYVFGGATLSETTYTFETYREFKFLPIEYKLDKTIFVDTKTRLDISDPHLKINIVDTFKLKQIKFESSAGKTFVKTIN